MQPLHFGSSSRPLFGLRHEARGRARQTAILICQSWAMEYLRAYRGLRQLAVQLSQAGFETLRFDYSGTGDSAGDSMDTRLALWLEDIRTAVTELRDLSGASRVCLLGLRMGGLLAARAIHEGLKAQNLVLWDTPENGLQFIDEMGFLQYSLETERSKQRSAGAQLPRPAAGELLGHGWPLELDREIGNLPLHAAGPDVQTLMINSADIQLPPPESAEVLLLPDASQWNERGKVSSPWGAPASLRAVVDKLGTWLP